MSDKLEQVQKQAIKIIFGYDVDYQSLVDNGTIETLKSRREQNSLKFAIKTSANPRFAPSWFPKNNSDRIVRETTRKVYREQKCRTERLRSNPINYMVRQLNNYYMKGTTTN